MKAGDEEGSEEGGQVLGVVGVRSLGAVEGVGLGVFCGLLLAGVGNRVLQTASPAGLGRQEEVEGIDEERRGGDGKNVTI